MANVPYDWSIFTEKNGIEFCCHGYTDLDGEGHREEKLQAFDLTLIDNFFTFV